MREIYQHCSVGAPSLDPEVGVSPKEVIPFLIDDFSLKVMPGAVRKPHLPGLGRRCG